MELLPPGTASGVQMWYSDAHRREGGGRGGVARTGGVGGRAPGGSVVQSGVPAMGWTIHRASSVEGPRSSFLGRHRNPPTGLFYFLYNFLFLFDLSFPPGRWRSLEGSVLWPHQAVARDTEDCGTPEFAEPRRGRRLARAVCSRFMPPGSSAIRTVRECILCERSPERERGI